MSWLEPDWVWADCRSHGHIWRHYEACENEPAYDECEECGEIEYTPNNSSNRTEPINDDEASAKLVYRSPAAAWAYKGAAE